MGRVSRESEQESFRFLRLQRHAHQRQAGDFRRDGHRIGRRADRLWPRKERMGDGTSRFDSNRTPREWIRESYLAVAPKRLRDSVP